jgi:hypothetical protein
MVQKHVEGVDTARSFCIVFIKPGRLRRMWDSWKMEQVISLILALEKIYQRKKEQF